MRPIADGSTRRANKKARHAMNQPLKRLVSTCRAFWPSRSPETLPEGIDGGSHGALENDFSKLHIKGAAVKTPLSRQFCFARSRDIFQGERKQQLCFVVSGDQERAQFTKGFLPLFGR